jgi:hypothetical protein
MLFYTNRTKFVSVVTVKLESAVEPTTAFLVGSSEFSEKIAAKPGYIDLVVDGGQDLYLGEGTVATFVSARTVK